MRAPGELIVNRLRVLNRPAWGLCYTSTQAEGKEAGVVCSGSPRSPRCRGLEYTPDLLYDRGIVRGP